MGKHGVEADKLSKRRHQTVLFGKVPDSGQEQQERLACR